MDLFVIVTILVNAGVFAGLGATALVIGVREPSPRVRCTLLALALVCGAFVLGAIQRLALQAYRLDLLSSDALSRLLFEWQLAKSLAALAFGSAAVVLLIRARRDLRRVERIARTFTERLGPAPPLAELGLTPRELEVLELMGRGSVRDVDIAAALQISPLTARTHVRNIMVKAGVTSRRDLVAFYLDLDGR